MTTFKSIHIKECWPFEYVAPKRRVFSKATIERANARKREQYWKLKAATVKTTGGKKLLKLSVYEMSQV